MILVLMWLSIISTTALEWWGLQLSHGSKFCSFNWEEIRALVFGLAPCCFLCWSAYFWDGRKTFVNWAEGLSSESPKPLHSSNLKSEEFSLVNMFLTQGHLPTAVTIFEVIVAQIKKVDCLVSLFMTCTSGSSAVRALLMSVMGCFANGPNSSLLSSSRVQTVLQPSSLQFELRTEGVDTFWISQVSSPNFKWGAVGSVLLPHDCLVPPNSFSIGSWLEFLNFKVSMPSFLALFKTLGTTFELPISPRRPGGLCAYSIWFSDESPLL